jgi:hypothetical protein
LAYLAGLLLVVAPVFYYYYQTSPDSFPYFLFGFHYDKINSDVGFSTKVVRLLMNVSYYPSLVLYFLAVLSQKITKTKRYANNDADMFFALWALGVVAILFLPIQIDFSVNVYSAYFIPPFLFLAGSLVESLNIRQIRTIFVCILVIEAIATYALLLDGFYSYSDVKRISRFVSENSEVHDTITGSYITAFTVSFLSGRELTEDALGLTSFDLMRAAMSRKRCDNLSYR